MFRNNAFSRILSSFALYAMAILLVPCCFIFFTSKQLWTYLVETQVEPVARALIAAEEMERGKGRGKESSLDTARIAEALNGKFYVGRQVPDAWRKLPDGFTIDDKTGAFIYIERKNGISYALSGSSRAYAIFMARISGIGIAILIVAIAGALLGAYFLSRLLSSPLLELARYLRMDDSSARPVPAKFSMRQDEIGTVARSLEAYRQREEKILERERTFAGDVSHELRTPLAVISGAVEILLASGNGKQIIQPARRIERAAQKMTATISALLALARQESMRPEWLDMEKILRELAKNALLSFDGKNCEIVADEPVRMLVCKNLAEIALGNLVANAFSYTCDGKVRIRIDNDCCEIVNPGIISTNAGTKSAGLGLSIAGRCCGRLGWIFSFQEKNDAFCARIMWKGQNAEHAAPEQVQGKMPWH